MNYCTIVILIYQVFLCFCYNTKLVRYQIHRADCDCSGNKDTKMVCKFKDLTFVDDVFSTNILLDVKEDIPETMSYWFELEKCASRDSPDTCEKFYEMKSDDYCNRKLGPTRGIWTGFYEKFQPRLTCPMKKGHYEARNATVDTRSIPLFLLYQLNGLFVRIRVTLMDTVTKEIYSCCVFEMTVKYMRTS